MHTQCRTTPANRTRVAAAATARLQVRQSQARFGGPPVRGRQRSDHMHRIEQPAFKARRTSRRNAEMVSPRSSRPSSRVPPSSTRCTSTRGCGAIVDQKRREQFLNHLRCRGDPGAPSFAALEFAGPLAERLGFGERSWLRRSRSSPCDVNCTRRPMRSNSCSPRSASSAWICRDKAGSVDASVGCVTVS